MQRRHVWEIEFINRDSIRTKDVPLDYTVIFLPKFHVAPIAQQKERLYGDRAVYNHCAVSSDLLKWVVQCVGVAETSVNNQRQICNLLLDKLNEHHCETYTAIDIFRACVNLASKMCSEHSNEKRDSQEIHELSTFRTNTGEHRLLQVPIYSFNGDSIDCEVSYCVYLVGLYIRFLLMEMPHPYDSPLQIVALVLALAVLSRSAHPLEGWCSEDLLLANYAGFCVDMLTRARFVDRWNSTVGDITIMNVVADSWSSYKQKSLVGLLSSYKNVKTRIQILLANIETTDGFPVWDAIDSREYLDLLRSCEKAGDDYGNMYYVFDMDFITNLLLINANKRSS